MKLTQISERGQITIPVKARRNLNLKPKEMIEIQLLPDSIVLRPVKRISAVRGSLRRYSDPHQGTDWETIRRETARSVAAEVAGEDQT